MVRLNLLLLLVLAACALGLVTALASGAQDFTELGRSRNVRVSSESNTGQLQLEASTWAVHARVERIASRQLHMRVPEASVSRSHEPGEAAR